MIEIGPPKLSSYVRFAQLPCPTQTQAVGLITIHIHTHTHHTHTHTHHTHTHTPPPPLTHMSELVNVSSILAHCPQVVENTNRVFNIQQIVFVIFEDGYGKSEQNLAALV